VSDVPRTPSEVNGLLQSHIKQRDRIQAYSINVDSEISSALKNTQPIIDELREQADKLASLFREHYQKARDAYLLEDYEEAQSYKQKGYEYETACRDLNARVVTFTQGIEKNRQRYRDSLLALRRYDDKIKSLKAIARTIAIPKAVGFDSIGISNKDIEESFLHLPNRHMKDVITTVSYSNIIRCMKEGRSIASYSVKDKIIMVHKPEAGLDAHSKLMRIKPALIHEVGHAVYHYVLNDEQKAEWHMVSETTGPINSRAQMWWKKEERRDQENFAECYRLWYENDAAYIFFLKIWKRGIITTFIEENLL